MILTATSKKRFPLIRTPNGDCTIEPRNEKKKYTHHERLFLEFIIAAASGMWSIFFAIEKNAVESRFQDAKFLISRISNNLKIMTFLLETFLHMISAIAVTYNSFEDITGNI